jgi:hypothetical protein
MGFDKNLSRALDVLPDEDMWENDDEFLIVGISVNGDRYFLNTTNDPNIDTSRYLTDFYIRIEIEPRPRGWDWV